MREPVYAVGVDPGLEGCIAVVENAPGALKPRLVQFWDMPCHLVKVGRGERRRYNTEALSDIIRGVSAFDPMMFAVEEVSGRANQRGSSILGYGVGLVHMAATSFRLPLRTVRPEVWKAALRCPANKVSTVRRAEALLDMSTHPGAFRGPKGGVLHDRAEAALIAMWAVIRS